MSANNLKKVLSIFSVLLLLPNVAWAEKFGIYPIVALYLFNIILDVALLVDLILLVLLYKNKFTIGRTFYLSPSLALLVNCGLLLCNIIDTDNFSNVLVGELLFLPCLLGLYVVTARLIKKSPTSNVEYNSNSRNAAKISLIISLLPLPSILLLLINALIIYFGIDENQVLLNVTLLVILPLCIIALIAGLIIIKINKRSKVTPIDAATVGSALSLAEEQNSDVAIAAEPSANKNEAQIKSLKEICLELENDQLAPVNKEILKTIINEKIARLEKEDTANNC